MPVINKNIKIKSPKNKNTIFGLPAKSYTDSDFWEKECETVLSDGWLFVAFANELKKAIISSDTNKIKSVKGIGLKTAERIILELKDKVTFDDIDQDKFYDDIDNTIKDEALSALSSLGISKNIVEKHINDILDRNNDISLEDLIKEVLKRS